MRPKTSLDSNPLDILRGENGYGDKIKTDNWCVERHTKYFMTLVASSSENSAWYQIIIMFSGKSMGGGRENPRQAQGNYERSSSLISN